MFRTLIFHINQSFDIERAVETAYIYLQWNCDIPKKDFTGVKLEELSKFEEVFAINVNIYSLDENYKATAIYKSAGLYEGTLYLDKYLNHVSYINNFKAYAKKFTCRKCKRYFKRSHDCNGHELTCDDSARLKYPGGFYSSKKNVINSWILASMLQNLIVIIKISVFMTLNLCSYQTTNQQVPKQQSYPNTFLYLYQYVQLFRNHQYGMSVKKQKILFPS